MLEWGLVGQRPVHEIISSPVFGVDVLGRGGGYVVAVADGAVGAVVVGQTSAGLAGVLAYLVEADGGVLGFAAETVGEAVGDGQEELRVGQQQDAAEENKFESGHLNISL